MPIRRSHAMYHKKPGNLVRSERGAFESLPVDEEERKEKAEIEINVLAAFREFLVKGVIVCFQRVPGGNCEDVRFCKVEAGPRLLLEDATSGVRFSCAPSQIKSIHASDGSELYSRY